MSYPHPLPFCAAHPLSSKSRHTKMDSRSSPPLRSPCCCFSCCSFKSTAIAVLLAAFFIAVANPILDELIAPLPPSDDDGVVDAAPPEGLRSPFDPSATDVLGYGGLVFTKEGRDEERSVGGLTYIMHQSFPRWATALMERHEVGSDETSGSGDGDGDDPTETRTADILDARRRESELRFEETGFALIGMEDDASIGTVANWRTLTGIRPFQRDLERRIRNDLYPNATRVEFTYNRVRGGDMFGDMPALVDSPHLDYTQGDAAWDRFIEEYPGSDSPREVQLLTGKEDTDDDEIRVLLGIWKPIEAAKPGGGVCDRPLAVMDARTFSPDREALRLYHISYGGVLAFHNVNGGVRYHDGQRWYYYPFQKESEVLVFTHYTKGRHFCNPHTSFENPNCPPDAGKRVSVEMRAAVFFPKTKVVA